jgi:hypothetical protein
MIMMMMRSIMRMMMMMMMMIMIMINNNNNYNCLTDSFIAKLIGSALLITRPTNGYDLQFIIRISELIS